MLVFNSVIIGSLRLGSFINNTLSDESARSVLIDSPCLNTLVWMCSARRVSILIEVWIECANHYPALWAHPSVGTSRVNPRFHTTGILWILGLTWEIPTLAHHVGGRWGGSMFISHHSMTSVGISETRVLRIVWFSNTQWPSCPWVMG